MTLNVSNLNSTQGSHHDHFAVLDLADELGLLAVPLLDVDQLVSLHTHGGLKGRRQECVHRVRQKMSTFTRCQMVQGGLSRTRETQIEPKREAEFGGKNERISLCNCVILQFFTSTRLVASI